MCEQDKNDIGCVVGVIIMVVDMDVTMAFHNTYTLSNIHTYTNILVHTHTYSTHRHSNISRHQTDTQIQ